MANFPIERARERLGFTPTTAVRADIDVRTGGGELAQAVSGFGKALIDLGVKYDLKEANTQFSEYKRNVEMSRIERDIEIKKELDQSKHEAIFKRYAEDQKGLMPTNRRAIQAANIWNNQQAPIQKQALVNARIFQTKDNEKTEVFEFQAEVAAGTKTIEKFEKFFARLIKIERDNPDDTPPTFTNLEAAKILADTRKGAIVGQITNLYSVGKYAEARTATRVAKVLTPREREAILNTIDAEERSLQVRAKEARQAIINKATSDTIREYFGGELTVSTLNQRHEAGLIKDSEFKFMMKGLTEATRTHSDPFAVGKIRRAETDLAMGAIDRAEADRIVLENYTKLDGADRSKVVADLEDVEAKIIAVAKSNAYDEGRGLMSQRFVGIQSEEDLIDLFRGAGLTEEEKERINRRWTAEVNNRDLYERAVDERFVEMRKEGISASSKYKSESLEILLQYQRKKQLGLEELEAEVRREQQQRRPFIGPPTPVIKPVSEMTMEEKQRELERIRELKRR